MFLRRQQGRFQTTDEEGVPSKRLFHILNSRAQS